MQITRWKNQKQILENFLHVSVDICLGEFLSDFLEEYFSNKLSQDTFWTPLF